MAFGETIKAIRSMLGFSQEEFAALLGTSKQVLSRYETNQRVPKISIVVEFAEKLHLPVSVLSDNSVTIADLEKFKMNIYAAVQSGQQKPEQRPHTANIPVEPAMKAPKSRALESHESVRMSTNITPMIKVPLLSNFASAGPGYELMEDLGDCEPLSIPDTKENRKADYAVRVKGDSMEPEVLDGDIVLVRSQPAVYAGEIGLFILNGNGYVKRYDEGWLVSLNDECADIDLSKLGTEDYFACVGKVVGVLKHSNPK